MKKILIIAAVITMAACNSNSDSKSTEHMSSMGPSSDSMSQDNIVYPYTATYSSKFEMGDPKHVQTILNLWKDWDSGDLSKGKEYFADSVEMHFADGFMLKGTRDSIMAVSQKFRSTLGTVSSTVHAFFPAKSIDKNENWVLVWGTEKTTSKDGKIDSTELQETWRLNKDGKVDLLFQFAAKATPPKK